MRSFIHSRLHRETGRFARAEEGTAIVLLAFSAFVLVGAAGLAFDAGRGYMLNARLSQAVDAAALAGGRSLSIGSSGDYEGMIKKYFKANLPDGYMGATVPEPTIKLNADGDRIEVTATATVPTTLMRVLGNKSMEIGARAVVHRAVKGLEVALVLDNSGSMRGSKIGDLKSSAELLVDILYGENETVEDLYVSIVPFTGRSNIKGEDGTHGGNSPNEDYVCFDLRGDEFSRNDAPPSRRIFEHYSGYYSHRNRPNAYKERVCPKEPVLPLTEAKSAVKGSIEGMQAKGCTRYDLGAAWGWRAISPEWQGVWQGSTADLPLGYDEPQMEKAIIIMTDGENTPSCVNDSETQRETEEAFAATCADMKAQGIVIYTITFKLSDPDTNTLFRECASGDERYFKSPSGDELEGAFTAIANDLSTLRLSQ